MQIYKVQSPDGPRTCWTRSDYAHELQRIAFHDQWLTKIREHRMKVDTRINMGPKGWGWRFMIGLLALVVAASVLHAVLEVAR